MFPYIIKRHKHSDIYHEGSAFRGLPPMIDSLPDMFGNIFLRNGLNQSLWHLIKVHWISLVMLRRGVGALE
jgi:hypothetical protein